MCFIFLSTVRLDSEKLHQEGSEEKRHHNCSETHEEGFAPPQSIDLLQSNRAEDCCPHIIDDTENGDWQAPRTLLERDVF